MIMLTEEEFAIHVNGYCQCGCTEPLIAHDREQRAEIERLKTELATATDRADKIEGELEAERLLERWTAIDKMRMDIASGKLDLLFRGPFTQILSELLVSWFVRGTDAINFVTWQIDHEATGRLEFVCQRVDGKTPSDLRRDAEAQRDAAIARAEKAEKERDEAREALRARDACRRVDFRFTDGELRAALRNVQPGTRDESLIHVAACAALDFSARAEKAEAALDAQIKAAEDDCHRWDEMERRIATEKSRADRAEAQLPEGMSHCTIVFRECALGHGWLTATNWTPFGCPTCAIHSERARADRLEAKLKKLIDGDGK